MVIMVKVCKRLHIVTLHSVRFIYSWVCLHVFMPLSIKLGQHHLLKKTWKTPEALSSKPSIHGTLTFTEQDIMRDLEIKASFIFPLPLSSKTFPLEHGGLEQAWPNTIPCSAPDVSTVPTSKSHRKLYCSAFTFWKLLIHLEIANILAAKLKSIWHQHIRVTAKLLFMKESRTSASSLCITAYANITSCCIWGGRAASVSRGSH